VCVIDSLTLPVCQCQPSTTAHFGGSACEQQLTCPGIVNDVACGGFGACVVESGSNAVDFSSSSTSCECYSGREGDLCAECNGGDCDGGGVVDGGGGGDGDGGNIVSGGVCVNTPWMTGVNCDLECPGKSGKYMRACLFILCVRFFVRLYVCVNCVLECSRLCVCELRPRVSGKVR
jgi:hypothetical protein